MPGGNIREENLEERIERIRRRDEEIEKKHREVEADRLAALEANAMVKTTAPSDNEWPKEHKYDKLDFTYDVKDDEGDEDSKKTVDDVRIQRNYKKFPDGQGPPADPTYNFLADAERDGTGNKSGTNANESDKKDWRSNSSSNSNRRTSNSIKNRNGGKSKSFIAPGSGKYHEKHRNSDEYNSWKNEREQIDDARVSRQKNDDGKWRREWDNNKMPLNAAGQNKGAAFDDRQVRFKVGGQVNSRNDAMTTTHSDPEKLRQFNSLPQKLSELAIEKRGNITVSITQDGEVKSVKLESARAIGTGRVTNNIAMRQNSQPQFNANAKDGKAYGGVQAKRNNSKQATTAPSTRSAPGAESEGEAKRSSVQDRLNRNRQSFDNGNPI